VSSARPGPAKDVTVNAQIGMMLSATTPLAIRAQCGPLPDSAQPPAHAEQRSTWSPNRTPPSRCASHDMVIEWLCEVLPELLLDDSG
jgi:hypothetical protein